MPKHIFLCDEISLYFISRIGIIWKFKFVLNSNEFAIYKRLKINRKFSYFLGWFWAETESPAQPVSSSILPFRL
jgi:hypothetical protein